MNNHLDSQFITQTRQVMGDERFERFLQAFKEEPSVSVRTNPFKQAMLPEGELVPWCENGYYLPNRPAFTFDPLLHAGAYYVQEAGSMFIDRVLRQYVKRPVTMLDLCAAPGGKSTVARTALPEGSLLFSNEPMRQRANVLAENLLKFGHPDIIVTNNYPQDYRKSGLHFDVILTDVPCSGEGMFRKDAGAIGEWSQQNVVNCQKLQREIVSEAWQCLKPGGLLIYSTCTFNLLEDEENALWIADELGGTFLPVDTEPSWNITPSLLAGQEALPVYRFIPGITRSEGLFVCAFRKPGDEADETGGKPKSKKKKDRRQENKKAIGMKTTIPSWIDHQEQYAVHLNGDTLTAIPQAWDPIYEAAIGLKILHAGITLGTLKGKNIIPHQSLAQSLALDRTAFPSVDVDYHTAMAYLRSEAISLPADTPTGYVLLTYDGQTPLGFVKNIGNRANNLYPAEWKIKSTHVPDTAPQTGVIINRNS